MVCKPPATHRTKRRASAPVSYSCLLCSESSSSSPPSTASLPSGSSPPRQSPTSGLSRRLSLAIGRPPPLLSGRCRPYFLRIDCGSRHASRACFARKLTSFQELAGLTPLLPLVAAGGHFASALGPRPLLQPALSRPEASPTELGSDRRKMVKGQAVSPLRQLVE
jgi:hypothetical protein